MGSVFGSNAKDSVTSQKQSEPSVDKGEESNNDYTASKRQSDSSVQKGKENNYETIWRKTRYLQWNEECEKKLRKDVFGVQPKGDLDHFNVFFFGDTGSGKTSFLNSILTAMHEDYIIRFPLTVEVGVSASCTLKFQELKEFRLKDADVRLPCRLYDCRGLNESDGTSSKDLISIIKGHVKPGYKINPDKPIDSSNKKYYIQKPTMQDKMHCTVYVVRGTNPGTDFLSAETKRIFNNIRSLSKETDIPQIVLLTHCDNIDGKVKEDITKLFRSELVKERVIVARDSVGLPIMNILPAINYAEYDFDANIQKNVLALFNFWHIVMKANAYAMKCIENDDPSDDDELE